jgi:hypothetical protein
MFTPPAALLPLFLAGVVHKNPPHGLSRDGKEMSSALQVDISLVNKPQESFVHKRCGLKRVAG